MKTFFLSCCLMLSGSLTYAQELKFSLEGDWRVRLDSLDQGENSGWYKDKNLPGQIVKLPGTLDESGIGTRSNALPELKRPIVDQLTRKYSYIGAAWYSREIVIPDTWKNKQVQLTLERVIWKTEVWVDGIKQEGVGESLVAPHTFNLININTPGTHTLTIKVDNRKQYDVSLSDKNFAHAYTEGTQVIWNGILGTISLEALNAINIKTVQVFPSYDSSQLKIEIDVANNIKHKSKGMIELSIPLLLNPLKKSASLHGENQKLSFVVKLDREKIKTWDEFNVNLYELEVNLQTKTKSTKINVSKQATFGFRKLNTFNAQLQINDRRFFVRGTLECAIFPLKGHPPMDTLSWAKIFRIAKSYGLNHLRFHSWCPPEAAFEAADRHGFYLQIELPFWSLTAGKDEVVNNYLEREALRIIENYGNHPSFVFWSMGNELEGNFEWLNSLVARLKQNDSRHLYTTTTFSFQKGHGLWPEPQDDYFITQYTKKGWIRGQGIFDTEAPNFNKDYSASVDSITVPVIAHEIGQYSVYPNIDEIKKYTGVLAPLNLEAVEKDLVNKNMLRYARSFTEASGKFAVQLYKEEIERALKTKGFSGFQLLDLHDFPGQGTALVGVLDAFWDSKGFVTPEEFRAFCSPVTLLIRYPKAVYTNIERFEATVEIANFSTQELKEQIISWTINSKQNGVIASGSFSKQDFIIGNNLKAGSISADLSKVSAADKLTIEVQMGTHKNTWSIWVYPEMQLESNGDVFVTQAFDVAQAELARGKKVLLIPGLKDIKGIEGKFVPVFWSPVHFPDQPGTMGVLVDPSHKVFQSFPTDSHSDWQWWDINKHSVVIEEKEPLIRIIDNFFKNRELGILYEFSSGKGKIVICTADILTDKEHRPAANQLFNSIVRYMNSEDFKPSHEIDPGLLSRLRK
ncbi:MAG TPA: sugar-binding domain-containing protein [Cyclobacteriaceae bacterium]